MYSKYIAYIALGTWLTFTLYPQDTPSTSTPPCAADMTKKTVIEASSAPRRYKDLEAPFIRFFDDPALEGPPLHINLKRGSLQVLIELISTATGINFIIDPDVEGTLGHLMFKDCTPGHILHVICMSNNPQLALIKEFNVWHIMRLAKARELYAAHYEERYEDRFFHLKQTTCTGRVKKDIEDFFARIAGGDEQSYLTADFRKHIIYARAPITVLDTLERYIQEIDICPCQVRIDAKIVIADKRCEHSWGFDWSGIYNHIQTVQLSGKEFDFIGAGGQVTDFANQVQCVAPISFAFNLVNKGAPFINVPFVFGGPNLNTQRLNLVLRAAEASAKLKIISRPTILTYNNEPAELLIGDYIPIQTVVQDVVEGELHDINTVNYKDVGTILKVTPLISPSRESIMLDILIEDSQVVDFERFVENKDRLRVPPVIKTIHSHNKVELCNGATTVIGGLSFHKDDRLINQVPFLSRIPFIGKWLFRFTGKLSHDVEQFIFITAHLVDLQGNKIKSPST